MPSPRKGSRFDPATLGRAACLWLLILGATASAEDAKLITLNMHNADIGAVLQWIADTTGKRVIIDPRVRGKLNILSRDPMTPEEAFRVVITAINVYGYTAIEQDGVLQIVPQANLKTSSTGFIDALRVDDADLPVNQVIHLSNLPADQVANVLRPLVPANANLGALPDSNALIITDTLANVRRIVRLADELDRNASLELDVVPLQHASAEELIKVLQQLLGEKNKVSLQLATDKRVNAIVLAGSDEMRTRARELIVRLDQADTAEGSLKVVYLHYLKASELVPVLRGMIEKSGDKGSVSPTVAIEASEATNALIISASQDRMEQLSEVIAKLDIRRAQVMIEAIIAEVSENQSRELGVEWRTAFNGNGTEAISRFSNGAVQAVDTPLQELSRGLTLGYFHNGSLRALLQALELSHDTNILSTPSVVTLDNQEAEILVGSNVPLISGQSTGEGSPTTNPFTTIERRDIGITLKVTPQVNQGDAITLDILQIVESLTDSQIAEDVVTDKRSLHTTVMLENEDILVLGGLIQDEATESVQKVPLLGDIPLLGRLFKRTTHGVTKKNLMIFVRARILNDLGNAEQETRDRYNHVRELQQQYQDPGRDPSNLRGAPVLPELPPASP